MRLATRAHALVIGAVHGLLGWVAFGLLEYFALSVLPAWRESSLLLTPGSRAGALAVVLGSYAACGAVVGGLSGLIAAAAGGRLGKGDWVGDRLASDLAPATLVLAWIVHLAGARAFSRTAYLALAVAMLLLVVLAARIARPRFASDRWTAWLASPVGVSLCLLAPLVFRDELHIASLALHVGSGASTLKVIIAGAGTGVLVLLLLARGLVVGAASSKMGSRARGRVLAVGALALLVLGAGWTLDARALARLGTPPAGPHLPAGVPGVLLVSLDAVRADHLSTYGYPHDTSPVLSQLAEQATVYLNARAASDMSLGTHASLFTGKYPSGHGAWVGGDFPVGRPLAASEATLAERLGARGWSGFAAVANGYFLNRAYGLTRGFELFDVPASDRLEFRWHFQHLIPTPFARAAPVHRPAREVNAVLEAGIEAAHAAGRPFFAFANYMEAHAPYTPDPGLAAGFPGYDPALVGVGGRFIGPEGTREVFDDRESRHLVSQYDGAIASIDRQFGVLLGRLRALGLYDSTLIIVIADHGEMLGEHGTFGHGAGLVDEVLHVPLIVKYPYQRTGRRVAALVSQVDIVPTVLDVLALPAGHGLDGISLRDAEAFPDRRLLAESPPFRVVYQGGQRVAEMIEDDGRTPAVAPASLDRLKSLGYVR